MLATSPLWFAVSRGYVLIVHLSHGGLLLSPWPFSFSWSLWDPSCNPQVLPFTLYCPVTHRLWPFIDLGSKVYIAPFGVHENLLIQSSQILEASTFEYRAAPDQPATGDCSQWWAGPSQRLPMVGWNSIRTWLGGTNRFGMGHSDLLVSLSITSRCGTWIYSCVGV